MISTVANVFPVCDYDTHIAEKNEFAAIQFYKSNHTVFSDSNERYRHAVLKMNFDRMAGHDDAFNVTVKAQMSSMSNREAHWYALKIGVEGTHSIGLSPESIGKAAKVVKKVKAIVDAYMDSIDWEDNRIVVANVFEAILKGMKFKMALVPNADEVPFDGQWRGEYWTQYYAIEDMRVVNAFCKAFEVACRECMA